MHLCVASPLSPVATQLPLVCGMRQTRQEAEAAPSKQKLDRLRCKKKVSQDSLKQASLPLAAAAEAGNKGDEEGWGQGRCDRCCGQLRSCQVGRQGALLLLLNGHSIIGQVQLFQQAS